ARVLAGGLVRRPHRVVLRRLIGHDDQGEDHPAGGAAEPLTGLLERAGDGDGGGLGQVDGHRVLPSAAGTRPGPGRGITAAAMTGRPWPSAPPPRPARATPPDTGRAWCAPPRTPRSRRAPATTV